MDFHILREQAFHMAHNALEEASITYSVTSGFPVPSQQSARDLDILLDRQKIHAATCAISLHFSKAGWPTRLNHRMNGHVWIFAKHPDAPLVAEIDLAHTLRWEALILAQQPFPDLSIQDFKVDSWAAFSKCILLSLLSGKTQKYQQRFTNSPNVFDTDKTRTRCEEIFGQNLTDLLFKSLHTGNVPQEVIDGLRSQAWKVARKQWKEIPKVIRSIIGERLASSIFQSRLAPIIAIIGPDGVGKSTLISALTARLAEQLPYTKIMVKHWRPGLLPALSMFRGVAPPSHGTANPPRREAGRLSTLRLLYYSLDFLFGRIFLDRKMSAFNTLIIYDRHYIDFILDPLRFGIRVGKLQNLLFRILPQPDFTFALRDDPNAIHSRKPELSIEEIESINQKISKLFKQNAISQIFSVTGTLEEFHAKTLDEIINRLTNHLFKEVIINSL